MRHHSLVTYFFLQRDLRVFEKKCQFGIHEKNIPLLSFISFHLRFAFSMHISSSTGFPMMRLVNLNRFLRRCLHYLVSFLQKETLTNNK